MILVLRYADEEKAYLDNLDSVHKAKDTITVMKNGEERTYSTIRVSSYNVYTQEGKQL